MTEIPYIVKMPSQTSWKATRISTSEWPDEFCPVIYISCLISMC